MSDFNDSNKSPGVCIPWEARVKEYQHLLGDEEIVKQQWEELDQFAYLYIWFVFTMF